MIDCGRIRIGDFVAHVDPPALGKWPIVKTTVAGGTSATVAAAKLFFRSTAVTPLASHQFSKST